MKYKKVVFDEMNARQKENYNFHVVASRLAEYGFNCIRLSDDWHSADFLAYHIDGETIIKVQLKSRIQIGKCYTGKGLCIAFPVRDSWYVIEHDKLIEIVGKHTKWLESESWKKDKYYSSPKPSKALCEALRSYIL